MAFFRGGKRNWDGNGTIFGLLHAREQLREGIWPIGRNHDKSILWQDNPHREYNEHYYASSNKLTMGDYLVYGWKRLSLPAFIISYLLLCWAVPNYIWEGKHAWMRTSAHVSVILATTGMLYGLFSRNNLLVIFDRRNKLVHISQYVGRRFHTVRWEEFDYLVIDHHTGSLGSTHAADIITAPPPWSLEKHGLPLSLWFKSRLIGHTAEAYSTEQIVHHRVEPNVEFIIDFMTQCRSHPKILNVTKEMDKILSIHHRDKYKKYRRTSLKSFTLIDPEKLPSEPNWKKDEHGNWIRLHKGPIVRAGWFGLWGVTHTLPPYLRGTRADPAHRNDPEAPWAGARWYTHEDEGTGELACQPGEVIEAVLAEGHGALARFPGAVERARKAREEATAYHNKHDSWVIKPDA